MAKKTTTFSEGDYVVYPLQGVGKIDKIEERVFKGEKLLYYVVNLETSDDMIVHIPVTKVDDLGVRPVVTAQVAKKALEDMNKNITASPSDWKERYNMNLDLIKSGAVTDIALVVARLYHRSKNKELPVQERKLFDNAQKLLIDEISSSMGKSKKEVEQLILCQLEAD
ncbi:MAG: CarD family transcriptional regulator [Spirochaetales bacterium]|nr:CarD family transcriptional regulator [Spirochaetales bacterium]